VIHMTFVLDLNLVLTFFTRDAISKSCWCIRVL